MKNIMPKIEYFKGLVIRFWLIILIAGVVGGFLGGAISRITYQPEYEMTQAFTIKVTSHPEANSASVSENQLSKTIPSLLSSEVFSKHMEPKIKEAGAKGRFKVTSLETSDIFYITCVAKTNNDAQIIINEIQSHYNEIANHVIGESQMKFLAPPSYSKLPVHTPKYTMATLIGIIVGAEIILAIFALMSIFSNTVTNASEIENEINTKCLAVIKRVYEKKRSNEKNKSNNIPLSNEENVDFEYKKSISTLSANVHQICSSKGFKALLVTSTLSGEGKSTVALNLAIDLADKGQKVVIVDCDLRSPSVAKYLGIDHISLPLTKTLKEYDYAKSVTNTDIQNLSFCGNIEASDNSFDKITDKDIKKLLDYLNTLFDYVIIDTPPVGFLGDAISISSGADCFLYVVSYNAVSKPNIIRCISTLNETNHNMLGFVLNNK